MNEKLDTLYQLGESLYETKEFSAAAMCYKEAAELFHPAAQFGYARCLEWGLGVSANADDAFRWYERAAQLGDAQALCRLGEAAQKGERGEPDGKAAFGWYMKAAQQAFPPAMESVGRCYADAFGVERDMEEAEKWYKKAAEAGSEMAQQHISLMERDEEGGFVQERRKEGRALRKR